MSGSARGQTRPFKTCAVLTRAISRGEPNLSAQMWAGGDGPVQIPGADVGREERTPGRRTAAARAASPSRRRAADREVRRRWRPRERLAVRVLRVPEELGVLVSTWQYLAMRHPIRGAFFSLSMLTGTTGQPSFSELHTAVFDFRAEHPDGSLSYGQPSRQRLRRGPPHSHPRQDVARF